MNHFAWGGNLHNSCKVIFKTTPVNVAIPFWITKYPGRPLLKHLPPPVIGVEELYSRLPTGNLRVESAITKAAKFVSSSLFI